MYQLAYTHANTHQSLAHAFAQKTNIKMHVERNRAKRSEAKQNNTHSYKQEEKRERESKSSCGRKRQICARYFDIQTTERAV